MAKNKTVTGQEAMLDSVVERDRASRALVGLLTCLIIIMIITGVATALFKIAGFFIGLGLSGLIIAGIIDQFSVYVPYTWGLVAQNIFNGEPVVYGSGWHWSFPWENVTEADNISLEERTSIQQGLTMASKTDELTLKISFQWRPDLSRLAVFRRMDSSTIESGFFEPLERFVSTLISLKNADEARNNQSVMSSLALIAFKGYDEGAAKEAVKTMGDESLQKTALDQLRLFRKDVEGLEYHFGITVTQVNISDIDFSEEVRRARAALAEQNSVKEIYYDIAGSKEIYEAMSTAEKEQVRAEARVMAKIATERQLNIRGNTGNNRFMVNEGD